MLICAESPPGELHSTYLTSFRDFLEENGGVNWNYWCIMCVSPWKTSMVKYMMLAFLKSIVWPCVKANLWLHHCRYHDQRVKNYKINQEKKLGHEEVRWLFSSNTHWEITQLSLLSTSEGKQFLEIDAPVTVDLIH